MKILNNINRVLEEANKSLGEGNELSKELLKLMHAANKNTEEINERDSENTTISKLEDVENEFDKNDEQILLEDIQEDTNINNNIDKKTVNKKVKNKKQGKKSNKKDILDFSRTNIVNGIVFNEILGKPKGLRRRW